MRNIIVIMSAGEIQHLMIAVYYIAPSNHKIGWHINLHHYFTCRLLL